MTALSWPFRYNHAPAPSPHCYLRYFEGNRSVTIHATARTIDVPAGVFALGHLRSMRIEVLDDYLDLYGIAFDGDVTQGHLFHWPGLPLDEAQRLIAAVTARVAVCSGDANKRIERTPHG